MGSWDCYGAEGSGGGVGEGDGEELRIFFCGYAWVDIDRENQA